MIPHLHPLATRRLPALLLSSAFLALTLWSWGRWPDALVDYGQQLYVAWRLAEGETLYRDLAWLHGPLSAWLHGGLMRVFGTHLWTLALFNHLVVAAVTALWLYLLRPLVSRTAAVAGALVFLCVFAFGQYLPIASYNWICPYTYEITHGIALALAAVLALGHHASHHAATGRSRSLAGAGLLLGLVFLTKTEVFLAALVALTSGVVAFRVQRRAPLPELLRSLGLLLGTAMTPVLAAALWLAPPLGLPGAFSALLSPYRYALDPRLTGIPLYQRLAGLDRPLTHLLLMLLALAMLAAVLGAAAGLARLAGREGRDRRWRWIADLGLLALFVVLVWNREAIPWLQLARPLPLLLLVLLVITGRRLVRRDGAETAGTVTLWTLGVLSLALLAKMPLSARLYHYGFALAMPGTVLLTALAVDRLPRWLARRGGRGDRLRLALVALVALAILGHLSLTAERRAAKTVWIDAGFDGFWADHRGVGVNAAVAALERRAAPEDTVLVVPDGILISYLARRPSSVRYLNWVPTDVRIFGEDRMLADLRANPPDWVVVVDKSTAEHGARWFGRDYARKVGAWIEDEFEPVGGVGPEPLTGRGFGVRWLRFTNGTSDLHAGASWRTFDQTWRCNPPGFSSRSLPDRRPRNQRSSAAREPAPPATRSHSTEEPLEDL